MPNLDVLILTGGQGSRLRSVVSDRPKTMAPLNGRPFLDLLIEYVSGFGFRRFILCVGYMAEYIIEYYSAGTANSNEIMFSTETIPLGTGGAVKNAERLIAGDSFLVLNGDSFCPVDFPAFVAFHTRNRSLVSIVLASAEKAEDYGSVVMDSSNRIVQFSEKMPGEIAWTNAGVYIFNKSVLSLITSDRVYSLEYDLFPQLAGKDFFGFPTTGKVLDIGTPSRLEKASVAFLK